MKKAHSRTSLSNIHSETQKLRRQNVLRSRSVCCLLSHMIVEFPNSRHMYALRTYFYFLLTLITTLLWKFLLDVDLVFLVFHFKNFFACQILCDRPFQINWGNDISTDKGEEEGSSFVCVLVLHSIAFLQLYPTSCRFGYGKFGKLLVLADCTSTTSAMFPRSPKYFFRICKALRICQSNLQLS